MARKVPEWIGKTDDSAIPSGVKLRILDRQRPAPNEAPICPDCGLPIIEGEGTEFDHLVELADGGENREANIRGKHRRCHKMKTARAAHERAGVRSKVKKAFGIKRTGRPMPGSRASGWKKPMNGPAVRRDQ